MSKVDIAKSHINKKRVKIQTGIASYYGEWFNGKKTASGKVFNHRKMTAAHKTLPFNTKVKVICKKTGKKIIVVINDRGPFIKGRIIDLSKGAAKKLGILKKGITEVTIEII
jgi:rare lipoprotein A